MSEGFLNVLAVEEVVARLEACPRLDSSVDVERISLVAGGETLCGRVLAEDLVAPETLPQNNRSGMDGYAVQAADLFGVSEFNPAWLDCVGRIAIDQPPAFSIETGQCAAIVTGGIVPAGADAVIMVEHTKVFGDEVIEMRRAVAPGEYVMRRGEDAVAGTTALAAGTVLRPQELGLMAALGILSASVCRRPEVAILSTGDELVPPQTPSASAENGIKNGQIRDVNSIALASMCRESAHVRTCGIVQDERDALVDALHDAVHPASGPQADVVFLSGGSSAGIRDLTLEALQCLGNTDIFCHGVALSPGKPLILARYGKTVLWGLPGQVTSAQVVMHILGVPFLRHLAGYPSPFEQSLRPSRQARLSRNIASRQGREDYIRVRLEPASVPGELPQAIPVPGLSGLLRTLILSDGIFKIPARLEGLETGTIVDVLLFDSGR